MAGKLRPFFMHLSLHLITAYSIKKKLILVKLYIIQKLSIIKKLLKERMRECNALNLLPRKI